MSDLKSKLNDQEQIRKDLTWIVSNEQNYKIAKSLLTAMASGHLY